MSAHKPPRDESSEGFARFLPDDTPMHPPVPEEGYNAITGATKEIWRITRVAALYRSRQRYGTYYLLKNLADPRADGIEFTEREFKRFAVAVAREVVARP